MRKIDGEIIQQAVEIGAKYVADDGTEFDNSWDCERYEAKLAREKQDKHFSEVYCSIERGELLEGDFDTVKKVRVKRFETKEDFLDAFNTLRSFRHGGIDYYAYFNDSTKVKDEDLPSFPATFIVNISYIDYEDSSDYETLNFVDIHQYVDDLQKKIDKVKKFL